ncbi:hypothetical protein DBR47_22235 [Paucibacter sp. KBW04]|uniref:ATP-binding protein n=1 Tax=Paucibacter sp. KBW04 TaxID=2153361 RepID=UPI000F56AA37|nr:ATP-binding protein [Paucibacter sp. KBW04]RQO54788.1 hypothetical protein DBR47_22235 [Paucibacter sp. KBW04]
MNAPREWAALNPAGVDWAQVNQAWLVQALGLLRQRLQQALDGDSNRPSADLLPAPTGDACPALLHIRQRFGLSTFETELLLLLAGVQLDSGLRQLLNQLFPHSAGLAPSFAQAMRLLSEPHWDALSTEAPLRDRLLLEPDPTCASLPEAPLRLPERLLHYIAGVPAREQRLDGLLHPLAAPASAGPTPWPALQQSLQALLRQASPQAARLICLQAPGGHVEALLNLCRQALAPRGLLLMRAQDLPEAPSELLRCARYLDREVGLSGAWPLLLAPESGSGAELKLARLLEQLHSSALLLGAPPPELLLGAGQDPAHRLLHLQLSAEDCRQAAEAALLACAPPGAEAALHAELARAARQFSLAAQDMAELARQLRQAPASEAVPMIWPSARTAARNKLRGLEHLASHIPTRQGLDALVLPPPQAQALRAIVSQLRQAHKVFQDWGFAAKSSRGQGLCALFAGDSGTGKTLAAEAIAHELGLDLYRIDLALLVSKYIGETEKNLKQVFDAAEAGGALLLFDEADALFGKRSEVKDSHDRHANIEVAYLLQRIESYRGMAILTSNMKSALDRAFLRRIPFIVNFPFPDAAARALIWQGQFPPTAPLGEIDIPSLARLDLSGAHIRNVVLAAAFRAAELGQPIHQALLLQAARNEYAKLDRPPGAACREEPGP